VQALVKLKDARQRRLVSLLMTGAMISPKTTVWRVDTAGVMSAHLESASTSFRPTATMVPVTATPIALQIGGTRLNQAAQTGRGQPAMKHSSQMHPPGKPSHILATHSTPRMGPPCFASARKLPSFARGGPCAIQDAKSAAYRPLQASACQYRSGRIPVSPQTPIQAQSDKRQSRELWGRLRIVPIRNNNRCTVSSCVLCVCVCACGWMCGGERAVQVAHVSLSEGQLRAFLV
jgi:hypothetical protein